MRVWYFGAGLAVLVAALAPSRADAQQCAGGRVASWATQGRCCWPGQSFSLSAGRCVGPPRCPSGTVAAGDECAAATGTPAYVAGGYGPVQPGAAVTGRRPLWGLAIPGIVAFGVGWVGAPIVTAAVGGDGTEIGLLAIPLAGPWICLGACYDPGPYLAAIIVDGIIQAAGLTMFILGLAVQTEVEVRADLGGGVNLALRPWVAPSSSPATGVVLSLSNP